LTKTPVYYKNGVSDFCRGVARHKALAGKHRHKALAGKRSSSFKETQSRFQL
jgi:hypothetical protein